MAQRAKKYHTKMTSMTYFSRMDYLFETLLSKPWDKLSCQVNNYTPSAIRQGFRN